MILAASERPVAFSVHLWTWPNRPLKRYDDRAVSEPQKHTPHVMGQPHPGPWAFWSYLCSAHTTAITRHPRVISHHPHATRALNLEKSFFTPYVWAILHPRGGPRHPHHLGHPAPQGVFSTHTTWTVLHPRGHPSYPTPCRLPCHLQYTGPRPALWALLHPTLHLAHAMRALLRSADVSSPTLGELCAHSHAVRGIPLLAGAPSLGSREPSAAPSCPVAPPLIKAEGQLTLPGLRAGTLCSPLRSRSP